MGSVLLRSLRSTFGAGCPVRAGTARGSDRARNVSRDQCAWQRGLRSAGVAAPSRRAGGGRRRRGHDQLTCARADLARRRRAGDQSCHHGHQLLGRRPERSLARRSRSAAGAAQGGLFRHGAPSRANAIRVTDRTQGSNQDTGSVIAIARRPRFPPRRIRRAGRSLVPAPRRPASIGV
jgi:hypothetical protein